MSSSKPNDTKFTKIKKMKILNVLLCLVIIVLICRYDNIDYRQRYGGIKCIDGDSFRIYQTEYRLAYVDTPEYYEPTSVASSKFTCNWLKSNDIVLNEKGKDLYNRILVEVVDGQGLSLNEQLVSNCLAEPFYGKTKQVILDLYKSCK